MQGGREPQFRKLVLDGVPADNEVLAFNSGDSTWKNQTAAEAGLAALGGADFTGALSISAALADITYTDTDGGDVFVAGNNGGKFRIRNTTDNRTDLDIDGDGVVVIGTGKLKLTITDDDGTVEGTIWYDASEDKLKFKTAAGVETITSS